ncbi:MAG: hypothetical protein LBR23_01610 [Spirochaetaceae bacterium]|jgi:hypothetical protein|nr:hypothetical protein [Spirochaetaceae bacterium]
MNDTRLFKHSCLAALVIGFTAVFSTSCAISRALYLGKDPGLRHYAPEEAGGEDVNGSFPDAVYIKTRTQTFNLYHYYIISDGHIWYKSASPAAELSAWTLFAKTGLLPGGKAAAELSADADELVALSTGGAFYRYCVDKTIAHASGMWLSKQGWPKEEPLLLDAETAQNRAWALGKRNAHVLYYEDPFGNQHHNGTMEIATTYMLMADGQEIRYADTGVPSDFSRNFIGPERGTFKAAALSAGASTMFVINDAGEMYTRLADFDTTGSDPMFFKYTYTPYKSALQGGDYFSNLTEWGLPPEDWRTQPPIPLVGDAAITRHITIVQNGQGNAARELRVAGRNAAGETGYWHKAIFDEAWEFTTAPLFFAADTILDVDGGRRGVRGQSLDKRYAGYLWHDRGQESVWSYEIPNFNILEGDCDFRVTWRGETCALRLHPVEMWTYLKRDYMPGRKGPPKLFMVTLEIPEDAYRGLSAAFVSQLKEKFAKSGRAYFAYTLAASEDFLILREVAKTTRINADGVEPARTEGPLVFLTAESVSNYYPGFSETRLLGNSDREMTRAELKYQIRAEKWAQLTAFKFNFGYIPAHYIARFSPLRLIDAPKIRTMTNFGNRIVLANSAFVYTISRLRIAENGRLLAAMGKER